MLNQDSYKQHISAQFNAELEAVKNHLLKMGGRVEQQLGAFAFLAFHFLLLIAWFFQAFFASGRG